MKNTSAVIRFCACALCVAVFLTYTSFKGLNADKGGKILTETVISSNLNDDVTAPQNETDNKTVQAAESVQSNAESTDSEAIAAAAGVVQGSVIEKFISPYTAGTSYGNVYLKNNTDLDINLKDFVNGKLGFNIEKNGKPQVLILHTHATESYLRHNNNYYTDADTARTTDN